MGLWRHSILNRFQPEEDEYGFWSYYLANSIQSTRYALILSIVLYAAFSILDLYMAPSSLVVIWTVRFAFMIPALFFAFYLTYQAIYVNHNQIILFATTLLANTGILIMIAVVKEAELAYTFYYGGLILCIIVSHSILRLRHKFALITTTITIVGYNLVLFAFQFHTFDKSELAVIVNNNFFLLSSGIIGIWTSSTTEKMFRKDYDNQELLLREKNELVSTKEKLQEADSIKNRLISLISHDIKGPISSLAGITSMFKYSQLTEEELKYLMSKVSENLNGTQNMLNSLLSWSLMQISDLRQTKSVVDLWLTIEEVCRNLKAQATLKNNQLINSSQKQLHIYSDPTVIKIILSNLITNAIKFTEKGKIIISTALDEKITSINVSDSGVGIEEKVLSSLFQWENRYTSEGTRNEKGSGIGLLICRDLVEKISGKITCKSTPKAGTTFTIQLPQRETIFNISQPTLLNPASSG